MPVPGSSPLRFASSIRARRDRVTVNSQGMQKLLVIGVGGQERRQHRRPAGNQWPRATKREGNTSAAPVIDRRSRIDSSLNAAIGSHSSMRRRVALGATLATGDSTCCDNRTPSPT